MNPGHSGFVFTNIADYKSKEFNLKKAHEEMKLSPDKFVRWSAKDFFYVMVRDAVPTDPSGVRWQADGAAQPPPTGRASDRGSRAAGVRAPYPA